MRGKAYVYNCSFGNSTCLFFLLISALCSLSYGEPDPQGAHDYFIVDCGTNYYPGSGSVVANFDVKYVTDNTYPNRLASYACPVLITVSNNALVMVDTTVAAVFGGSAVSGWSIKTLGSGLIQYSNPHLSPFHLVMGAASFSGGLDPGTHTVAHIKVQVNNVCTVDIDTLSTPYTIPSSVPEAEDEFDFAWGGPPGQGYVLGTSCAVASCVQTYATGTGTGVLGDFKGHLDTYFNCSQYVMRDITRQAIYSNAPGHVHQGRMPPVSDITTQKAGVGLLYDTDNNWNDTSQRAPVDAHVYAGYTYDYMNQVLQRNSFDDSGSSMFTIVGHSGDSDNAAFLPSDNSVRVYQASPDRKSMAGSLDVLAHEWGHAIIKYSSALVYRKESGSLEESFGNMLAAVVESTYFGPTNMWKIAERSYTNGSYDWDMAYPHLSPLENQPDTYLTDTLWADLTNCTPYWWNDSCWVHHNAGVPNKMFYLLSKGGTHNNVTVTGIGAKNALAIMYKANKEQWDSTFTFVQAAVGSILAAFNTNYISNWPQQTSRAWWAVNVCTIMPGDLDASGFISLTDVIRLVNYVFDKDRPADTCLGPDPGNCWTPVPLCRGEINGVGIIGLPDIIWLVDYVFDKDRPGLSCLGTGSINCWLPIPSDVCCRLP